MEKNNKQLEQDGINTRIVIPMLERNKPKAIIETEKADHKIRGRKINVLATFCPFCGVAYDQE